MAQLKQHLSSFLRKPVSQQDEQGTDVYFCGDIVLKSKADCCLDRLQGSLTSMLFFFVAEMGKS